MQPVQQDICCSVRRSGAIAAAALMGCWRAARERSSYALKCDRLECSAGRAAARRQGASSVRMHRTADPEEILHDREGRPRRMLPLSA